MGSYFYPQARVLECLRHEKGARTQPSTPYYGTADEIMVFFWVSLARSAENLGVLGVRS